MQGIDISFPNLGIAIEKIGTGINVFGFKIAFYGMTTALGMFLGLLIARWQAKRTGQNPDLYSDLAVYAIIFSVIGARAYYVIFTFSSYKDNLWQIFNIRAGGQAIYGSIIAGVLTAVFFARRKKYSLPLILDTAVLGLILGQIVGRLGNFFNREAFGDYTNNLLAMRLKVNDVASSSITDKMNQNMIVQDGIKYIQVHPTFLYEMLWNIVVLIILILYTKKKKIDGELFLIYLIGYGAGRAWIEGLRTDQLLLFGTNIPVSQVLSGILVVGGIGVWVYLRSRVYSKSRRQKTEESHE